MKRIDLIRKLEADGCFADPVRRPGTIGIRTLKRAFPNPFHVIVKSKICSPSIYSEN